jgi:hypothetical protein
MLRHFTGGRYDGRDWPVYNALFNVPQWEADMLVGGGNAEYPDEPELNRGWDVLKAADVDYEHNLHGGDTDPDEDPRYAHHNSAPVEAGDFDNDFDGPDSDSDFDEPNLKLPRPKQQDSKQAWVDYVVSLGVISYGDAKNLTKNALMDVEE